MKISELPHCPDWLKNARTENAEVYWGCGPKSYVVWLGGDWRRGEWLGGEWLDGEWRGGLWRGGVWRDGVWRGGEWLDGEWRGGEWRGGVWRGGVWRGGDWRGGLWLGGDWRGGEWLDGEWRGGEWRGGLWRGGVWRGGVWLGGKTSSRCKWLVLSTATGIAIGCKEKTISEWDAWFAGKNEFDTPRDSDAFRLIRANYEAVKAFKVWSEPPAKKTNRKKAFNP